MTQLLSKTPLFASLRFPEAFEDQFQNLHLARCRNRARLWLSFLIMLNCFHVLARVEPRGMALVEIIFRLGVLIPAWAVLSWITWSSEYGRVYGPLARIIISSTGVGIAALVARNFLGGQADALSELTAYMLGLMFLSGLLFRHVMWVCALITLTFSSLVMHEAIDQIAVVLDSLSSLVPVAIGGFVCYEIEKDSRLAFVEHAHAADQADNDGLTGLRNRRAFDKHLRAIWLRAAREARSLGLLLLDADEFKHYNDHYGHQAGDRCLRKVADVVRRCAGSPLDLAARIGGEEFAVILFDIDPEQVRQAAEKLRGHVEALAIEHRNSKVSPILTVSIGAACVQPSQDRSPDGLVQLADEALYAAKHSGRNRVNVGDFDYDSLATGVFRTPMV